MQRLIAAGFAALAFLVAPANAEEAPPPACTSAAHRALDFWIGEWDAYNTGTETLAGRSSIKSEDAGCVITEHWTSARAAFSGRSLNLYDASSGKWRQFWADSFGDMTDFKGEAIESGVRFVAEGDVSPDERAPHIARMTLTRNADGSVRQIGETSPDGAAWTVSYDFTYRRRA
jgi:hypothetical protein